ncbi:MAG: sulfatase [Candidatus Eiseniibacteriota bacterium]
MATLSRSSLLSLGALTGAALGAAGGAAETLLQPQAEALRPIYAVAAYGLLGMAAGTAAATFVRRREPAAAVASILGLVAFLGIAAALGLFANRVLLRGTNFLGAKSLAADAVVVAIAAGGAVFAARRTRALLERKSLRFAPGPGTAAVVAALLGAATWIPGRFLPAGTTDLPPVVLVSIDTLRPDRLSGGGEPRPTSPVIDKLCREGTLWPEAVTASPGSAASHAALLSSRYPVSNGVWANFSVLDESVEMLAERLRAMGYRTGGFVTNTFLGRRFGFDQGFDVYVESGTTERLHEPSPAALFRSLAVVQIADRIRYRLDPGHDPSFEAALDWLRESEQAPFLFVHLMDVHSPYVPPQPWGPRFRAGPDGEPGSPEHRNRFGWRPSVAAYIAEIAHMDSKIGRLRRVLEEEGLLDRGVLVLTSDHGENLLDHLPNFTHGSTVYESTLRVLAAVRAPGRAKAGVLDPSVLENVDWLPTLADLLGWERSEAWEGVSLGREVPADRLAFAQLDRDFAVRSPAWKLLVKSGERVLYDLLQDPGETGPSAPDSARRIFAEDALALWMETTATPLYTEQARSIRPEELSEEVRDRLRALGYIE